MPFIPKAFDRNQVMLTSFDSLVDEHSIARIIDYFVNHVDLAAMGFSNTNPSEEGRPCYPADCYVKLYLYGYRNNIRSSRKLEKACKVNVEVMWLMGGLKPDFRSISDFRKNNIDCMRLLFKEFIKRVTVDEKMGFVSVDGSKFKAWNSKDRNFTIHKLDDRIQWLEDHVEEYLRLIDISDENEDIEEGEFTKEELDEKLRKTQERLERYCGYREYMEANNLTQISLTDADSRLMKNKNGMEVSYNVQTAVDSDTHLMLDYQMTNQVTDHGLIASTLDEIRQEKDGILESVADKGYQQDEDMIECLENGIIPNVILPDGKDTCQLDLEYVETEHDTFSTAPDEIKKTLQAGEIPAVYNDFIEKIEVVEVRRLEGKSEQKERLKSPYGSEEEMRARAAEGYFVRDPEADRVYCPGGAILRHKCIKLNGATRYANKAACKKCPYRAQCTPSGTPWKETDFGKDSLEKKAHWWPHDDDPNDKPPKRKSIQKGKHYEKVKMVRITFRPNKQKMSQRLCISEHPFGTIKRAMGATYFLLKGKSKVSGEFALLATGYNLSRVENMFGFDELMRKVGNDIA